MIGTLQTSLLVPQLSTLTLTPTLTPTPTRRWQAKPHFCEHYGVVIVFSA